VLLLLVAVAAIYASCGPLAFVFPIGENNVGLPTALWFGVLVSLGVVLMAGTSILLVALTKEQAELRSTSALAAARDIATEASEQKTRFLARMSHELRAWRRYSPTIPNRVSASGARPPRWNRPAGTCWAS
jgi:signal transduction histidine kinase